MKYSVFVLFLFVVTKGYSQSTSIFDYLKSTKKHVEIRSHGQGDIHTFQFIRQLQNKLGIHNNLIFLSYFDNFDLRNYHEFNDIQDDGLGNSNCTCIKEYLSIISKPDNVYGGNIGNLFPYLRNISPSRVQYLEKEFRNKFQDSLQLYFQRALYLPNSSKKEWIYQEAKKILIDNNIDSLIFSREMLESRQNVNTKFRQLRESLKSQRIFYFKNYFLKDLFKNQSMANYLKDDSSINNSDSILVINFIIGEGSFSTKVPTNGEITYQFKNKIKGEYGNFEIISYEDLPLRVAITHNKKISRKWLESHLNIYINKVNFCRYNTTN